MAEKAEVTTTVAPPTITLTQEQFAELMAKVNVVDRIMTAIGSTDVKKNGHGGRKVAQPILDTKTGVMYPAKCRAGMAVAETMGMTKDSYEAVPNPNTGGKRNWSFVWYDLIGTDKKPGPCVGRFESVTPEAYAEHMAKIEPTTPPAANPPKK